jgi:HipA-like C-terminal domain
MKVNRDRQTPPPLESVKFFSDYQRNWAGLIPHLKRDHYRIESTSDLSIHGDAPKCFLLIKEYVGVRHMQRPRNWLKFIAKIGSKWYPVESITEQLITRIGQCFGFAVADSRLRVVGPQVRFLSRYFLHGDESLTHGIEIFRDDFGHEMVEEIAQKRWERDFYIFPAVVDSLTRAFPEEAAEIVPAFVRMLLFDAIIGNNDRHPANWGVITSPRSKTRSRFAPIFDTARGLFWNSSEEDVRTKLRDRQSLEAYIRKSQPQVGWENEPGLTHFLLLARIAQSYSEYKRLFQDALAPLTADMCAKMLWEEFGHLLSAERIELILRCVGLRIGKLRQELAG